MSAAIAALLSSCGGGGSSSDATPPFDNDPQRAQRVAAATATAEGNAECTRIRPFYWEVGDRGAALASGSVGTSAPTAATRLPVATASKWLYAGWYVQRTGGALDATDLKFLRMQSGYTSFAGCTPTQTVAECAAAGGNAVHTDANDGRFAYGGGHMQQHAVLRGLGGDRNADLAADVRAQLGADVALDYGQPQPAGGAQTSAGDYAKVLRRMLDGSLRIGAMLGDDSICASTAACPGDVVNSPAPRGERWRYSIGHWVEDPATVSDGAYSSPGLFGFYPWIDKTRTWYGVIARLDNNGALDSVDCGRLVRRAWVTGAAQ